MSYQLDCRYFSGYKPCGKNEVCSQQCQYKQPVDTQILIIHLGALGAVVRSTALLPLLRNEYPNSSITWITEAPAQHLLLNNPFLDRVLTTTVSDLLELSARSFDVAYVIDKNLKAAGILNWTSVKSIKGFVADSKNACIRPASSAAQELWELGLDNNKKFFKNQKTELQLMLEALELKKWEPTQQSVLPEYQIYLSSEEETEVIQRRKTWSISSAHKLIGLNTGCSDFIPYKKWTVEYHRSLLLELLKDPQLSHCQWVLLGGPEDTLRNQEIIKNLPLPHPQSVIGSATELGLRDGLVSVAACDLVITGDSLGMHMAISFKKPVLAWFGPTCEQEISLYGRGLKIKAPVSCGPCWKRQCDLPKMCFDSIPVKSVIAHLKDVLGLA